MGMRIHDVIHHGWRCTTKNSPSSHWVKLCHDTAFPNPIWAACWKLFKVLKVTKVSNLGLEIKHQNLQQRLANQPKMLHVHTFKSSFACMLSWFSLFSLHLPSPLFLCSPISRPPPSPGPHFLSSPLSQHQSASSSPSQEGPWGTSSQVPISGDLCSKGSQGFCSQAPPCNITAVGEGGCVWIFLQEKKSYWALHWMAVEMLWIWKSTWRNFNETTNASRAPTLVKRKTAPWTKVTLFRATF